jgi:hypothetical protein
MLNQCAGTEHLVLSMNLWGKSFTIKCGIDCGVFVDDAVILT